MLVRVGRGCFSSKINGCGGAITLEMNGRQEVLSLTLKPEVVDPEDLDMLQDLIIAAVNDAIKTSQEMVSSEITKITGGFSLPGL